MKKMKKSKELLIRTIEKNNLFEIGDRVLIALSGGADSVLMTVLLSELKDAYKLELFAAHVNHGIRGAAADGDEAFSKDLCERLSIPFFCKRCSVPKIAREKKMSEESAGRMVRYEFFDRLCEENSINKIATAHHMDDNAETILMNIIRGTGSSGLSGIEYKNGRIVRPMLDFNKKQILEVCREENIEFCTDETNSDTSYTRNNIRHVVLPHLETINPNITESLVRQANILSAENNFMKSCCAAEYEKCKTVAGLDIKKLSTLHIAVKRRIIFEFLARLKGSPRDITFENVSDVLSICESGSGTVSVDIGGLSVCASYGILRLKRSYEPFRFTAEPDKWYDIPQIGKRVMIKKQSGAGKFGLSDGAIVVRSRLPGDAFQPDGMKGTKKVKDFFIDLKIPEDMRGAVPILTCGGDIVAVGEFRCDRRFSKLGRDYLFITDDREVQNEQLKKSI